MEGGERRILSGETTSPRGERAPAPAGTRSCQSRLRREDESAAAIFPAAMGSPQPRKSKSAKRDPTAAQSFGRNPTPRARRIRIAGGEITGRCESDRRNVGKRSGRVSIKIGQMALDKVPPREIKKFLLEEIRRATDALDGDAVMRAVMPAGASAPVDELDIVDDEL